MNSVVANPKNNLFGSLESYLNPEEHPPLPCVRLPTFFYQDLAEKGAEIWVKMACANPFLQGKWIAAWGLLSDAQRKGQLEGVHTLVENSSGNTIAAETMIKWIFGIRNAVGTVALDTPMAKLEWLRLIDCKFEPVSGGIAKSREMGKQDGWWCSEQYHSEANPDFFAKIIGEQLWNQLGDLLMVLAAALGTSGTLEGSSRKHRKCMPGFRAVGVVPWPDQMPGARSVSRLGEIGLEWRKALNGREPVVVTPKEAYFHSLWLSRYGLLAGPSGGGTFAGLLKDLWQCLADGTWEQLQNREGKVMAAFVCQDTPIQYLDKYTTHLEPEDFEQLAAMPGPFA